MGIYNIRAAVPSPYVNVICANAAGSDLAPLVYANMTNVTLDATLDFANLSTHWYTESLNWTEFNAIKSNPLDEVFGWTKPSERPAFYKFPANFNTVCIHVLANPSGNIDLALDFEQHAARMGPRFSIPARQRRLLSDGLFGVQDQSRYNALLRHGILSYRQ